MVLLEPAPAFGDLPAGMLEPSSPTFAVVESSSGEHLETFAVAEVATGLPDHVRRNIAEWRARHRADELEAAAGTATSSSSSSGPAA